MPERSARWVVLVALVAALVACDRGTFPPRTSTTSAIEPTTTSVVETTTAAGTSTLLADPSAADETTSTTSTTTPPSAAGLFGTDWERIPVPERVVALTFDAGANDTGSTSILDTLAREQVPATFFLTGSFVDAFPASARAMAAHRVGNHSVTHPHFTELSDAQIRTEITQAGERIEAVTGADPAPWFRFPFGDRDGRTIEVVNSMGYVPVRWTVDTLGWKGTSGGQSVATVQQRVLDGLTDGQIVLMHVGSNPDDGTTLDADALPGLIELLRDRGYSFVTLDALLAVR